MNFKVLICTAAICTAALSGCTPSQKVRGNIVQDYQLAELSVGESTERDVLRALGSPTTKAPFNDNVWYYMGQEKEKRGVFDAEVVNERIVMAAFDEEGTLAVLEEMDEGRVDLPLVRRKTETGGNEVTALQQMLGNLGRFNAPTN